MSPRDRALVCCQWLTGARISEVLALTIGDVCRPDGRLVPKIGFRPAYLKGGYGTTRWVPISPELDRALGSYLGWLRRRWALSPKLPLFMSRQEFSDGSVRPITRETARQVIRSTFAKAGVEDDGRLGTHSLRKSWAASIYINSGRDLLVVKACLGHSDIAVTQRYLSADESAVEAAMRKVDFTRPTRRERAFRTAYQPGKKDLSGDRKGEALATNAGALPVPFAATTPLTMLSLSA